MTRKRNTDPGVYSYPTEAGKRWGAVVSLPKDARTGKRSQRRKQGFLTKVEALAWKREQADVGTDSIAVTSRQPLNAYLDDWLASLTDLAPNTRRSYRNSLVPVRNALGRVPIGEITAMRIEQFNSQRSRDGTTAPGVYQTHRIFKRAIRRAHALGLIQVNPFAHAKTPRSSSRVPVAWTREDMVRFLEVNGNDPVWGDLWHVLCETWMRVGEVTDLRWRDIDFSGATIAITHAVARDDKLALQSGPTKTESSRRVIHVSDALVSRLRLRKIRAIASTADDLIFPPIVGVGFLHASAVSRALKRSCIKAGVPEISTHDIRHNGGSIAYMAGVDIDVISKRMGHTRTAVTFAKYIHLNRAHHNTVAQQIGALIRGESDRNVIPETTDTEKPA